MLPKNAFYHTFDKEKRLPFSQKRDRFLIEDAPSFF